jgi:hypothetical protein
VNLGEEAPFQIDPADVAQAAAERRPSGVDADGLLSMLLPKGALDPVRPASRSLLPLLLLLLCGGSPPAAVLGVPAASPGELRYTESKMLLSVQFLFLNQVLLYDICNTGDTG